ncbi:MAG: hypothetical protein V4701_09745 [Pseudomonadota bacterium]
MHQNPHDREDRQLAQGARMVVAALASAVLTATVVIAVGHAMIDQQTHTQRAPDALLIRTSG